MERNGDTGHGKHLSVLGVPVCKGQRKPGTEESPKTLREWGLIQKLEHVGCDIFDAGDLHFDFENSDPDFGIVKNPRYVGHITQKTADSVEPLLRRKGHCLALGGDHCIAVGTIMGHARVEPDVVVLWIDAHADINTPLTTESGNIHGMTLSFLVKELQPYVPVMPGWEAIKPCISANDVAWIGLRDVDVGERKIIEQFGMNAFSMHDVDTLGIKAVIDKALKALDPTGTRPIHVSFDVDALDPSVTPSTGTAVDGGLTVREIKTIAEELAKTGRVTMIDVVEVNPKLGSDKEVAKTLKSTIDILTYFYGQKRQGITYNGYR